MWSIWNTAFSFPAFLFNCCFVCSSFLVELLGVAGFLNQVLRCLLTSWSACLSPLWWHFVFFLLILWHINYFHIFDLVVEEVWSFGGVRTLCFFMFLVFLSCDLLICWDSCLFQFYSGVFLSLWGFNPKYHSEKRKETAITAIAPNQIRKHN